MARGVEGKQAMVGPPDFVLHSFLEWQHLEHEDGSEEDRDQERGVVRQKDVFLVAEKILVFDFQSVRVDCHDQHPRRSPKRCSIYLEKVWREEGKEEEGESTHLLSQCLNESRVLGWMLEEMVENQETVPCPWRFDQILLVRLVGKLIPWAGVEVAIFFCSEWDEPLNQLGHDSCSTGHEFYEGWAVRSEAQREGEGRKWWEEKVRQPWEGPVLAMIILDGSQTVTRTKFTFTLFR
jgi:hypothetical protein